MPSPDAEADRFDGDARAAGISPPRRRKFGRFDVIVVIAVTIVIVAASLEIGHLTGWIDPSRPVATGPALAGPAECTATSAPVHLSLGASPNASTSLSGLLAALTQTFTNQSGSCLTVGTIPAGFSDLSGLSVASVISPETPLGNGLVGLANATFTVPLLGSPVVVIYHAQAGAVPLNLTADALAGIFLGTLTDWNDSSITAWNPGLESTLHVTPFYYSGPSAANAVVSEYLSEWNSSFRAVVGPTALGQWPAGQAVSSPAAMLQAVESTTGSIGYEATNICPALPLTVSCARVQAANDRFVNPSIPAVLAAANVSANTSGALDGNWANVSGVVLGNATAYPMIEFTYAVVYHDLGSAYGAGLSLTQATWLLTLFWWIETFEMTGYQANNLGTLVSPYGYVALPASVAGKAQVMLSEVDYNGTSILFPYGEEGGEPGNETGEF